MVGSTWLLGAPVDDANIGYPVALPARQTGLDILPLEVRRKPAKPGWVRVLKGVDVDDRVQPAVDFATDEWHRAAAGADVKRRGSRAKGVPGQERRIGDPGNQRRAWMRCPHAAVLDAEGAVTGPGGNLRRFVGPLEREADVAAVASSFDLYGFTHAVT